MTKEKKEEKVDITKLNIHQKLHSILGVVNYIKKDTKIEFGNNSFSVTNHDSVTELIHPLLVEYGINLIPTVLKVVQDGNRTRVDLSFDWVNVDNPKDRFTTISSGYGVDQQDKGIGKAWSYAQRYAVLKTLHLVTGEKDIEEYNEDFSPPEYLKGKDKDAFIERVQKLNIPLEYVSDILRANGIENSNYIPLDRVEEIEKLIVEEATDLAESEVQDATTN